MNNIKSIETIYDGHRFRSRLEARYAMFFNELHIKWVYEPEGFVLSDGTCYLPDFYLPESDSFFEVKGVMSDKDMHKIEMLIRDADKQVIIGYPDFTFESCNYGGWDEDSYINSLTTKSESVLVNCRSCQRYYFSGIDWSFECRCCDAYDGDHFFNVVMWGDGRIEDGKVRNAIFKAQQAQFERWEEA